MPAEIRPEGRIGSLQEALLAAVQLSDEIEERRGRMPGPIAPFSIRSLDLAPELFAGRHINVEIETEGEFTIGMTVADWWRVTGREANATFIRDVDAKGFFDLLTQRIGELDRRLGGATG